MRTCPLTIHHGQSIMEDLPALLPLLKPLANLLPILPSNPLLVRRAHLPEGLKMSPSPVVRPAKLQIIVPRSLGVRRLPRPPLSPRLYATPPLSPRLYATPPLSPRLYTTPPLSPPLTPPLSPPLTPPLSSPLSPPLSPPLTPPLSPSTGNPTTVKKPWRCCAIRFALLESATTRYFIVSKLANAIPWQPSTTSSTRVTSISAKPSPKTSLL